MCVIIIKQTGKKVANEIIKTSSRVNPHGLGVIWLDTFEITYHKSKEYKVLNTDRPYIAHFRYATVGAVNRENTHPFQCGNNVHEWLMMNGTIPNLGNVRECDSKVLARQLGSTPRHTWAKELSRHLCRFVTVNTRNRTFQIYNKELWTEHEGVWFSKDNVLEKTLVAVYGTLKKGYSNYHHYLSSSKFVGKGTTKFKYPLVVSGLPYLIDECGKGHKVEVDVFKVSDSVLKELDRLEGHPTWYRRRQVAIEVNKKTLRCWVYFNLTVDYKGQKYHERYVQEPFNKIKFSQFDEPIYAPTQRVIRFDDLIEDDNDFNREDEQPVCVDCFNDLEFDGFCNYHCNGCGGWFTESEVLHFKI
jgi:gamma-glutamylaminecyclotransferase